MVRYQDNRLTNLKPHYYVYIKVDGTEYFITIIITSQFGNRVSYYNRTNQSKASQCLVKINNNDFSYLDRDSAINCNEAEYSSIDEIINRVDESIGFDVKQEPIQPYLRKEIVSAIIGSPLVKKFIKELAKKSNPI